MSAPSAGAGPVFRWDTLTPVGRNDLHYQSGTVSGMMYEVELTNGTKVRVWRSDDGQRYFCHGLSFGGTAAPGGAISPYTGQAVETILGNYYQMVPEGDARAGDVLVWSGAAPDTTPHSAILMSPVIGPGTTYLADATRLRSKNGMLPEAEVSLGDLVRDYGKSYTVYRRR